MLIYYGEKSLLLKIGPILYSLSARALLDFDRHTHDFLNYRIQILHVIKQVKEIENIILTVDSSLTLQAKNKLDERLHEQ